MVLDNGRRVGIGTDAPAEALEIGKGHTHPVIRLNDPDNRRLSIRGPSASNFGSVGTESANSLMFFTNGYSNERLRITTAGDVGINTTAPQNSAKVQYYTSTARHQSFQSSNGDLAIVSDNNSSPVVYVKGTGTADLLNVFDNTTEVFTIKDGGNVGINEDDPAYPLEVVGDGGGSFAASSNSTNGVLSVVGKNSSGGISAISRIKSYPEGSSNQSHMAFETRNSANQMVEAIRISATQQVGISTITPRARLHVRGSGEILRLETTASGGGECYIDFDDETATRASIGMRGSSSDTLTMAALNGGLRFDTSVKHSMNIAAMVKSY